MTSPPEEITVQCPKCGHLYEDWTRASVNLDLDDFDEEYLEQCSTATCPECHYKIDLDVLIVEDGVFQFGTVADWEEGFAQLTAYVQANGSARVPNSYRTFDGFHLGGWVGRQRSDKDRLSADRRQRLDAVDGWMWNAHVDDWEEGFGHLVAYVEAEGHARVPFKHQTAEGYPLGQWVGWQRYQFDNDSLSADRRQRLDAIDEWVWDANVADWEEGFAQLTAYAQANGSARVPKSYRTVDGFHLGGWVGRQRSDKDRLSKDRRQRLDAVDGWVWNAVDYDVAWEEGFGHLVAYVQANGSARVRKSHRTTEGHPLGERYSLGAWVETQRAMYKKGRLSEDRIQRLEALPGWAWDANVADWEEGFGYLVAYVQAEGTALVPGKHRTFDGFHLGAWVNKQRNRKERGRLSADRRQRLDAIDEWVWDANVADWEEGFGYLVAYVETEGHARVPGKHQTAEGYPLGRWVNKQRNRKERGRLSADRRQRLDKVDGWVWNVAWEDGFWHLVAYVQANGSARVRKSHRTTEGYPLGVWVGTQRAMYKKGRLSEDCIQRLEALPGWAWDANVADWEEGFTPLP